MKKYIFYRLLNLIPTILGITLLSFLLMSTVSGDVVDMLAENLGTETSAAAKASLRMQLGLDRPLLVQYASWLAHFSSGDMGQSFVSGQGILELFCQKLPNTLFLTLVSVVLTVIISLPLGIYAALHQNRASDYLIRFFTYLGNSVPGFFMALLLILAFSVQLKWLPLMTDNSLLGVILPAATLAIAMSAKYIRQIRTAIIEEWQKEYVIGAKARGVPDLLILKNSVLRVVLPKFITLMALSVGSLLGGTAIIETIFMWDGLGKLAVSSINMRDYPVVLAYVVWMACIYVLVNLLADLWCYRLRGAGGTAHED